MAVAAAVVGDLVGPAVFTAQRMPTECRAAALLDSRHDLELTQAQVRALRLAPSGPMETEDVGDFQGEAPHVGRLRWAAGSGLLRREMNMDQAATSCSSACSPPRTAAGPRPRCSGTASSC